ncbi:MAG: DUF4215 domain-containing protein, partial [Deltaproteobacteria bacterium]|nr:DUF4215 domain-containing protein [Deltaproteobacteria bacterium]
MSAPRRHLLAAWALLALGACAAPDAGLELTVRFDPALALDQLAVRLQAGETVEEVRAPEPPTLLGSGEETLGFLLPDALVDVEVTVAVQGFGDGAVVPGAALVAEGQGVVTPARGEIVSLVVELTPLAVCGNGVLEGREACDDGNAATGDGCDESCAIESGYVCAGAPSVCALCGDGSIDEPESCDDGGQVPGDGCDASCAVESGWQCDSAAPSSCTTVCGDGLVRGAEACDDGNTGTSDGCDASCAEEGGFACDSAEPSSCATVCGDGLVRGAEACDDSNANDDDGCSAACALESGWTCGAAEPTACATICGDGLVRGGEACDDQVGNGGDGCSAACAVEGGWSCDDAEPSVCAPTCGDGLVRGGEACDDGNTAASDGCTAACAEESGFDCTGEPSACATVCGDGVPAGTEACDDGAANGDSTPDACRTDCTLPFCGDLVVDSGEGCDDGDLDDRDGCRTGCRLPACGDGLVLGAEGCDDGDSAGGDGCNANCGVEGGFSCFGEPSVCAATALTHVVAPAGGQFTSIDAADNSGAVADGHFLFVRAGTYAEEVDLAKDLTLVGESGARVLANANNAAAIRIRGSANVTLQGLTVEHDGNNQPAIELRDVGGAVTVTDCVLGPTNNLGLESLAGTTVTVRRTLITGNPDGGADLNGTVLVENSVMIDNGSGAAAFGGARLRSAATFRFNTVVDNLGATGVLCDVAATVGSSILWGNAGPEASASCAAGTSWVQGVAGAADPLFLGDGYHLGAGSPVLDRASAAGCPSADFDGQERPMGADCE